jgi:hypothetical protein
MQVLFPRGKHEERESVEHAWMSFLRLRRRIQTPDELPLAETARARAE